AGNLFINNPITGNTGVELTKDGPGTLILSANNSAFTGPITAQAGALRITDSQALGLGSTTTIQANAELQVQSVTGIIKEQLRLNGSGTGGLGALHNIAGNNTWGGNIELDSDTTIGADLLAPANTLTSLNITGVISDLGGGHSLSKEGGG